MLAIEASRAGMTSTFCAVVQCWPETTISKDFSLWLAASTASAGLPCSRRSVMYPKVVASLNRKMEVLRVVARGLLAKRPLPIVDLYSSRVENEKELLAKCLIRLWRGVVAHVLRHDWWQRVFAQAPGRACRLKNKNTERSGAVHSSTRLSQKWIKRDSPEFVLKY